MEPEVWAAIAAWAGFVASASAGYFGFRQARTARAALEETKLARQTARDQAQSARESAIAASKSADAALWQARNSETQTQLARADYDRADRPQFLLSAEPVRADWVVVRARVQETPSLLYVEASWVADAVVPAGEGVEEIKLSVSKLPEMRAHVARNDDVSFGLPIPPDAVRGEIRLVLACAEQGTDRTWQPVPEVVRWERPPASPEEPGG